MREKKIFHRDFLVTASITTSAFIFSLAFSRSLAIAAAFASFALIFLTVAERKITNRNQEALSSAAPEVIDHLISGIQSGLSLNESLCGLSERGPELTKATFQKFKADLLEGKNFERSLRALQNEIANPAFDQIIESLAMSHTLGGAELLNILRLLGNFTREDLAIRREIAVKQRWIKNSAHMSAAAPWLLLLLLSTQPSTSEAFSTPTGVTILISGLLLTAIAYIWMNKLSALPQQTRIFKAMQ